MDCVKADCKSFELLREDLLGLSHVEESTCRSTVDKGVLLADCEQVSLDTEALEAVKVDPSYWQSFKVSGIRMDPSVIPEKVADLLLLLGRITRVGALLEELV